MKAEHLIRQADLIPASVLSTPVTVIGAGAIGSFTVLSLAKMGLSDITVWDYDEVSEVNMNCQFFPMACIGQAKVLALKAMVTMFTGTEIKIVNDKYTNQRFDGIVISAVDSMAVRKQIWKAHRQSGKVQAVIDPRMGAEFFSMYVMRPRVTLDMEAYLKVLYKDSEAEQERCTAKATMYTVGIASGMVCKAVKDIITDGNYARITNYSIKHNAVEIHTKEKL